MAMQAETRRFLEFLRARPDLQSRICAPADKTLVYAGAFIRSMWEEVAHLKQRLPQARDKKTLTEVLAEIPLESDGEFTHLLAWIEHIDQLPPRRHNGYFVWRVLSGIYASNAIGKVSFQIGSGVSKESKIFASVELDALERNPNIDSTSREMLGYFRDLLEQGRTAMNAGFIAS